MLYESLEVKVVLLQQKYFNPIVFAFRKTTWKLEGSKEMKAQPPLHTYENGENKADCNKNICTRQRK